MSRYIDADKLLDDILKNHYLLRDYYNSMDYGMFTSGIRELIDEQPAVFVEEPIKKEDLQYA